MLSSSVHSNCCTSLFFPFPRRNSPHAENKFSSAIIFSKIWRLLTPPPAQEISLIHEIDELYKAIYTLGRRIPKRDRYGLFSRIEAICIEFFELIITAAFEVRFRKFPILHIARIKLGVLKRLTRAAHELGIIDQQSYIALESRLQKVSKMITGWMQYLQENK